MLSRTAAKVETSLSGLPSAPVKVSSVVQAEMRFVGPRALRSAVRKRRKLAVSLVDCSLPSAPPPPGYSLKKKKKKNNQQRSGWKQEKKKNEGTHQSMSIPSTLYAVAMATMFLTKRARFVAVETASEK